MSRSEHTPEPWFYERGDRWVRNDNGETIARVCDDDGHCEHPEEMPMEDNGARIAECVTALAGMDPRRVAEVLRLAHAACDNPAGIGALRAALAGLKL